jgi:hypothetical protein
MELDVKNVKDAVLDKIRAVTRLDRAISIFSCLRAVWARFQLSSMTSMSITMPSCFGSGCSGCSGCSGLSLLFMIDWQPRPFSDLLPVVADSTSDWSREIDVRHSVVSLPFGE